MGSPNSSDDHAGESGVAEGGGSDAGAGGEGARHETAEEAQSSLFFTAFSAFVSVSGNSLYAVRGALIVPRAVHKHAYYL